MPNIDLVSNQTRQKSMPKCPSRQESDGSYICFQIVVMEAFPDEGKDRISGSEKKVKEEGVEGMSKGGRMGRKALRKEGKEDKAGGHLGITKKIQDSI